MGTALELSARCRGAHCCMADGDVAGGTPDIRHSAVGSRQSREKETKKKRKKKGDVKSRECAPVEISFGWDLRWNPLTAQVGGAGGPSSKTPATIRRPKLKLTPLQNASRRAIITFHLLACIVVSANQPYISLIYLLAIHFAESHVMFAQSSRVR